jgi:sugar lactone lactonase YvrE
VVTQVDTIAVEDGIRLREVCRVPADRVHTRLNDGCVDRDGALWVGTYSLRGEPEAVLLHVDPSSGEVAVAVDGLVASNGLAWSADGERLFAVDTGRARLDVYDRVEGVRPALRPGRLLVDFAGEAGRPDGIALDADSGVWVAMWGGGEVRRYAPDGDLDAVIRVPVTYPTSVAFGGADLATLFVTTSRIHLAPDAVEPLAGHVLAYESGAHGIPLPAFAG